MVQFDLGMDFLRDDGSLLEKVCSCTGYAKPNTARFRRTGGIFNVAIVYNITETGLG